MSEATSGTTNNGTSARLTSLESEMARLRDELLTLRNEVNNDRLTVHVTLTSIQGGVNEIRTALLPLTTSVNDQRKDIEDINRWRQRVNTWGSAGIALWGVFASDIKARLFGGA